MYKKLFLFIACITLSFYGWAQTDRNLLAEEGAWCWFADPRALSYKNETGTIDHTYIGYIDNRGNIKATQINHLKNTTNEVLIRSYFQPDDHNNPTFLILPDERVMIFYSRHTDEACFYYRISREPGDITSLGKEVRLETTHNTTYPSPFILSDDPDHIYLCWRGIGWHPTIARLTMPDRDDRVAFDWGPYQIVRSKGGQRGVRPYAKYSSNGKDKIYMAYTTTHPDNQPVNYIYFNYLDINTRELKDVKNNKLATVGTGMLHEVDAAETYKTDFPDAVVEDSPFRNWLWEVAMDKEENPVIAMVRISEDKESHAYYHVRWTGNEWKKTFLSHAGGHFHQTPRLEKCYSGGMAIDKFNPNIIYGSVPVEGKYGRVYELKKFEVTPDGKLASVEQVTFDSPKNNVRPFMIPNTENHFRLAWMVGDYYDWIVSSSRPQGYATAIYTNMNFPAGNIDLKKGLLKQEVPGKISHETKLNTRLPGVDAFTVALTLSIDTGYYYGQIIKAGNLIYGLTSGDLPKPYIKIGTETYSSSNVLGNSDGWKKQNRGTGGQWYAPEKLKTFRLVLSYGEGILKTYINGLVDQSLTVGKLSFSDVTLGGFKGVADEYRIYDRVLSQDEIKALDD